MSLILQLTVDRRHKAGMIKMMLIAGAGGFLGTCGRFLVQRFCAGMSGGFPLGTFTVNVAGCFLIGLFYGLLDRVDLFGPGGRLLFITGFCGGFTTFSTFAFDICELGGKGEWMWSVLYIMASVIVGVLMVLAGRLVVRCFAGV